MTVVAVCAIAGLASCTSDRPGATPASSTGQSTDANGTSGSGSSVTATTVADSPTDTSAESTTSSSTTSTSTTTTLPLLTEGVVLLVANASEVSGAAGNLTDQFALAGYSTIKATNAAGNERELDATKVYFVAGFQTEAATVAAALGGVPFAPMPTPAWIDGGTDALNGANVLVMLGLDLAGQPIPALANR